MAIWELKNLKRLVGTLLLIAGGVFALTVHAYTSPGNPDGFVNDFGRMLSQATVVTLESALRTFEEETTHEIAVVTIESLGGDDIEGYAVTLFEEWGIGKKGSDNGILLLIARNEREMRIEVGFGLEGALTDAESSQIIRNILTPAFRAEQFDDGVIAAVMSIEEAIKGEIPIDPEPSAGRQLLGENMNVVFWIFLIAFTWLGGLLARTKSWWLGGVIGSALGLVIGLIFFTLATGVLWAMIAGVVGLLYDFIASRNYQHRKDRGLPPSWWMGGGFGGGSGGGSFGGFGGGGSGGGGASGGW